METAANLVGGMFVLMGIGISVAVVLGVYWLWMLVDCMKNPKITGTEKAVWVLIVLCFNWIGGLVYYFTVRKGESTGFFNFIGLGFALLMLVVLVIGLVHSLMTTPNTRKETTITGSIQANTISPNKQ